GELRSKIGKIGLVVNRVKGELSPEIRKAIDESGLQVIALIPEDSDLAALEMKGKPVTELPQDSSLQLRTKEMIEGLGL
ncbi:MAG: nucleotide-binding protein, partial [Candidatus Hermodarchaeia archaeon]